MMTIADRVYKKIEIADPLIAALVSSKPMERLRRINQSGGPVFLEPERNITRFEHSVGVWYLLKRFGASRKEQAAGLLHDTPHTAFSHVVDVVFPNENHTFHERFTRKVILESEIPEILKKHGLKTEDILKRDDYHLLEAELPDLSADRIDYFLRDTRPDLLFPDSLAAMFLDGLFVDRGVFYFKDRGLAALYATLFITAGRLLWLDPNSHGSFYLLAEALKRAMKIGKITREDFFLTDEEVFAKLRKIEDPLVRKSVSRLRPTTKFEYAPESEADFSGPNKPRVVDPWVKTAGGKKRVSQMVPRLKEFFEHYRKTHKTLAVKMKAV